jgi:DNA modification methylase
MEQIKADGVNVYCRFTKILDITELKPNPQNPNRHPAQQIDRLAYIIENNGWRNPIVVSNRSGYIVKGHGRLKAAQKLGVKQVPVEFQDYATESDELADLLADNRIAELAEFDVTEGLKLIEKVDDKALTGFSEKEIADFMGTIETAGDDDAPELEEEEIADSKPGELYKLGNHLLLCGDSTDPECIKKVLQGQEADLIITDPPYNVDYTGKTKDALKIKGDKMSDEGFYLFLRDAYAAMFSGLKDGGAFYIWHADIEGYNFRRALTDAGQKTRQCLVWVKNTMVLGRQDYQWKHEPCQPAGTLVRTPNGDVPIEQLKDGDRVVSFDTYSGALKGLKEGLEIKTASREYEGEMYSVTIGNRITRATDNHQFSVRFNPAAKNNYCTYLMKRGDWWRVGITRLYDARGFGAKHRFIQEKAEEMWLIETFEKMSDAQIGEQTLAVKYGIPYTCWEAASRQPNSNFNQRTKEQIEKLYANLDLEKLKERAMQLLKDYKRSERYPLITAETKAERYSRRVTAKIHACNLIPELMELPIPFDGYQGTETFEWQPITQVTTTWAKEKVYSLSVEKYEHYIADGIVTHNCLYGWKEGAGHCWSGRRDLYTVFENPPDFKNMSKEELLEELRRLYESFDTSVIHCNKPPANREHPTMKPVELFTTLIFNSSRTGEILLDPFGGSGTSIIAAEKAERKARIIELDPKYCDVIRRRWTKWALINGREVGSGGLE